MGTPAAAVPRRGEELHQPTVARPYSVVVFDPFSTSDESYRTCSECGRDCEPDASVGSDGLGARIAFACPDHGVQSIVDPFEHMR